MKRYAWIVTSNAAGGQEAEFNRWYDETHLPDLLRIPGVKSAERFELADTQTVLQSGDLRVVGAGEAGVKHRYLAIYWIETDDLAGVLQEVRARSGTPEMAISPALAEASAIAYEQM